MDRVASSMSVENKELVDRASMALRVLSEVVILSMEVLLCMVGRLLSMRQERHQWHSRLCMLHRHQQLIERRPIIQHSIMALNGATILKQTKQVSIHQLFLI